MKILFLTLAFCASAFGQGILMLAGNAPDVTAPAFASAVASGTTLTVNWSEAVSQGAGYDDADFDLDASVTGANLGLTYSSGNGTATWVFTIASSVVTADTLDLDYAGTANGVEDAAGNDLAAIVSASVSHPATRFYFPSTGAAAVSPAFSGSWTNTTGADRRAAVTTKISSASATKTSGGALANNQRGLNRQYVSAPLAAQTITGNIIGQMRHRLEGTTGDRYGELIIRVCSNDGSTILATLKDNQFMNPLTNTLVNRFSPVSTAITPYACAAGDRIVFEFGMGRYAAGGSSATVTQSFGDDSGTDLPANDSTTDAFNPWLEFETSIVFQ